jgi:hypothetical protein
LSLIDDIADLVVLTINQNPPPAGLVPVAVLSASPDVELEKLSTNAPVAYVRLSPVEVIETGIAQGSRGNRFIDIPIEIVVALKGEHGSNVLVDSLTDIVWQIDKLLFDRRVYNVVGRQQEYFWMRSQIANIYDADALRHAGLAVSAINVTFRTIT